MKLKYLSLCLMLFVCAISYSQNPDQTAKYKKKSKKGEKEKEYLKGSFKPTGKDKDGDGVNDYTDKCPGTLKGEKVTSFGCPYDSDFDNIYDYEDRCPDEKGPKENGGCPWGDKDSDRIPDNEDECPEFAGIPKFSGCPDTDKDGVKDSEDACPEEFGKVEHRGCPASAKDADGDGLFDNEDLCPNKVGLRTNKGCPDMKPEDKAALQRAFDNLLFETAKDKILPSSFSSLNDLSVVLKNNTNYKLHLEGHTDNKGDSKKNLDLSKRRAAAVEHYLEGKGVSHDQITSEGYGDTKPKDTNDTEAGRAKNRRVEMLVTVE